MMMAGHFLFSSQPNPIVAERAFKLVMREMSFTPMDLEFVADAGSENAVVRG
jgi:hypothetical protein